MKRKMIKDIRNIVKSMRTAHTHAASLILTHQLFNARELLSQCQECAVKIGETIEKEEGLGTQAVSYLETYCEQLYELSQCTNRKKIIKLRECLDSSLRYVKGEIDKNISCEKLKVVFLPYKASMWDCMESVWRAAEEDQGCETYVVPIPYYERAKNGEMQKLCYEGDVFPDDVPIIHYKDFLLERERPDIIYIHNPYDGTNYVTSIHPDYFSSRLKTYTDQLVYIPYYFNGDGPMDETHKNLSAYYHIDKIILQDENKAESLQGYVAKDKIAVIGSPKVDRLIELNSKKQEILKHKIPQEWQEKIAGKTVILYNVSISGMLKNSDYALDKIRYVISEFEQREDVVLLWRPHPLIEATLRSMRPEMYEKYVKIKRDFVNKEKGIFDETEDAGIAAVISDAYVGESSSSLVHYFGVLGKPILYTNWDILEDKQKDRDHLYFHSYFIEDNEMYFVPAKKGYAHILFKLNLENGKTEKVLELPGTPDNKEICYYGIVKKNNKIVLVPHNGEDIYIYDTIKSQSVKMVLSIPQISEQKFCGVIEYKEMIYLIPGRYPAIISINMQTQEICELQNAIRDFISQGGENGLFISAWYQREKYLYLVSGADSRLIIFNMETLDYEIKNIGDYTYGYGYMVYDGKCFWLSTYGINRIVRWDEENGDTKEYTYPMKEELSADEVWSALINRGEEMAVCPGFSAEMIFINKKTGKYRYYKPDTDDFHNMDKEVIGAWKGYFLTKHVNDQIVAVSVVKNASLNLWNTCTDQWQSYLCRLPKGDVLKIEKIQIEKERLIKAVPYYLSERDTSISQFVDYVKSGDVDVFQHTYKCYQGKDMTGTIGSNIHRYIKGLAE